MDDYSKTKSGEFFKAMQDVKRKAAAETRGSKAVEGDTLDYGEWLKPKSKEYEKEIDYNEFKKKPKAVEGDTLDYNKLRKEYANKAKDAGDSVSRRGIKSLSKGLKSIPVIGALASLMSAEDASAAVPILDSADAAGMSSQDENVMMGEIQAQKDYGKSQAHQDRLAALAKLAKMRGE
jgi:cell division protein FtsL